MTLKCSFPSLHVAALSALLPSKPSTFHCFTPVCAAFVLISHWKITMQTHPDNGRSGSVSQRDIKQKYTSHYGMTKPGKRRCITELADNRRHAYIWCVTKLSQQQADKHIKILLSTRHEFLKLIPLHPWCSASMKTNFKVLSCWLHPSCGLHWQVVC